MLNIRWLIIKQLPFFKTQHYSHWLFTCETCHISYRTSLIFGNCVYHFIFSHWLFCRHICYLQQYFSLFNPSFVQNALINYSWLFMCETFVALRVTVQKLLISFHWTCRKCTILRNVLLSGYKMIYIGIWDSGHIAQSYSA